MVGEIIVELEVASDIRRHTMGKQVKLSHTSGAVRGDPKEENLKLKKCQNYLIIKVSLKPERSFQFLNTSTITSRSGCTMFWKDFQLPHC